MNPGCIFLPVEYSSLRVHMCTCVSAMQRNSSKYSANVTTQHTSDDSLVSSTGLEPCTVVWGGYEIETTCSCNDIIYMYIPWQGGQAPTKAPELILECV